MIPIVYLAIFGAKIQNQHEISIHFLAASDSFSLSSSSFFPCANNIEIEAKV